MKKRMIITLGFISITLFILSLSIAVTINFTPLYAFDIGYLSISESINMSRETILLNYRVLMEYLNSPWLSELAMPDFPSSERGLFHFVEVKRLFLINYSILLVSGIGTGSFIVYSGKKKLHKRFLSFFRYGILLSAALITSVIISFDRLFLLFHQTFFNNDAWLFDPSTDPIIRALPAAFFMHTFVLAFGLVLVLLITGYLFTKSKIRTQSRTRSQTSETSQLY